VSAGTNVAESTAPQQDCQAAQQQVHDVKVGNDLTRARADAVSAATPSLVKDKEVQRTLAPMKKASLLKNFDSDELSVKGYCKVLLY